MINQLKEIYKNIKYIKINLLLKLNKSIFIPQLNNNNKIERLIILILILLISYKK